jgi:hypothetical protein
MLFLTKNNSTAESEFEGWIRAISECFFSHFGFPFKGEKLPRSE